MAKTKTPPAPPVPSTLTDSPTDSPPTSTERLAAIAARLEARPAIDRDMADGDLMTWAQYVSLPDDATRREAVLDAEEAALVLAKHAPDAAVLEAIDAVRAAPTVANLNALRSLTWHEGRSRLRGLRQAVMGGSIVTHRVGS